MLLVSLDPRNPDPPKSLAVDKINLGATYENQHRKRGKYANQKEPFRLRNLSAYATPRNRASGSFRLSCWLPCLRRVDAGSQAVRIERIVAVLFKSVVHEGGSD